MKRLSPRRSQTEPGRRASLMSSGLGGCGVLEVACSSGIRSRWGCDERSKTSGVSHRGDRVSEWIRGIVIVSLWFSPILTCTILLEILETKVRVPVDSSSTKWYLVSPKPTGGEKMLMSSNMRIEDSFTPPALELFCAEDKAALPLSIVP